MTPATDGREGDRSERAVCNCLRTKMQYVAGSAVNGWGRPSSTAQYWCLETMNQVGPDDGLVTPQHCQPGRECFGVIE